MKPSTRSLAGLLLLALVVVLVRAVLVGGFSSPMPYWDQWDAEAANWLKPWVEGDLTFGHLLRAHNEHRVAYTRLWSLLWFEANGGIWDNLVLALASTLLSGLLAALLYGLLRDGLATRWARGVFLALVLVLALLPFGWENLLVGFQSQFQFMALFALWLLAVAARADDRPASVTLILGVALLGLPTMATGVLAPVAAGGVLVLRAWTGEWRVVPAVVTVAALAVIALAGLAAVPHLPGHDVLHPESLAEGWRALGNVLAWPVPRGWWVVPALWLPTAGFLWQLARRRKATAAEWIAIGLSAWTLLQALAITWSRGRGLDIPSSRYTDLLAFGLAANAWLALRAREQVSETPTATRGLRLATTVVLLLCLSAIGLGLGRGLPTYRDALDERRWYSGEQAANVREFLLGGDPGALVVPPLYIPYPHARILETYLTDPVIRAMLPATLTDGDAGPLGRWAGAWRARMHAVFPVAAPEHPAGSRRWRLPVLEGPLKTLQVVAGVEVAMEFPAPRNGHLASVALQLGTYGQRLPGMLVVQACSGGECARAGSALGDVGDNQDIVLVLDRPLRLRAGEPLQLHFGARDTNHPAAIWLAPPGAGTARIRMQSLDGPRDDLAGLRPRLVLGLLP